MAKPLVIPLSFAVTFALFVGAPEGITVMASDIDDKFAAAYSNYGPCTDILAPGTDIESCAAAADGGSIFSTGRF